MIIYLTFLDFIMFDISKRFYLKKCYSKRTT